MTYQHLVPLHQTLWSTHGQNVCQKMPNAAKYFIYFIIQETFLKHFIVKIQYIHLIFIYIYWKERVFHSVEKKIPCKHSGTSRHQFHTYMKKLTVNLNPNKMSANPSNLADISRSKQYTKDTLICQNCRNDRKFEFYFNILVLYTFLSV